jgi:nucleoside-diphosphate-sugar epimerase
MRILVAGHAGFVGGYLTNALLAEGHQVVGLDKRPMVSNVQGPSSHTGNILDKDAVLRAMTGTDMLINLAAEHQDWGISRETYFQVNQLGTRVLLDCASELGIRQCIFFSSVAVYGTSLVPSMEKTRPEPDSDYGASKLAAEEEVRVWAARQPSNSALIVRPTVIYGPSMNDYSNIYRLVDQVARHHFFFIGRMATVKSLAYVENVVDATLFLLKRIAPGVETFNITDPQHLTSREIATYISKCLGTWIPPVALPYKAALALAGVLDVVAKRTGLNLPITAARIKKVNTSTYHRSDKLRLAGFEPKYTVYQGLEKTCHWYAQEKK